MRTLLAVVLGAAALAAAGCDSGEGRSAGKAVALRGDAEAASTVAVEGSAGAGGVSGAASAAPVLAPLAPLIVRTASLQLKVAPGRLDDTVDRARTLVSGLGGFVASSSETDDPHGTARATLVLRVPAATYARALPALARLGTVQGREESGEDVSGETVDLRARADHLAAVERQLLELLDRAQTVAEALEVRSQLDGVQLELEQTRARLRFLDDRVAYSTVTMELSERAAAAGGHKPGVVGVWRDALHRFLDVAGGVLVAFATVAPLLVLAGLAALGIRLWLRSRRRPRIQ